MPTAAHILPALAERYPWWRRWLGTRSYWLGQLAFWGLLAAFLISNSLADAARKEPDPGIWTSSMVIVLTGIGLTHLVRVLILAVRARAKSWLLVVGVLFPVNVAVATGMLSTLLTLALVFSPEELVADGKVMTGADFWGGVGFFFALISVWNVSYFGCCYYRGYRESLIERLRLEAAVKESELRTLKAQVNPHFLFNSLNTLRSMIPGDLERPREAVTLLAELLRASLTLGDRTTVSVAEELETVESYLGLEQLRFEKRLRVRARVHAAAREVQMPPFVLQTLVENAVKFGVGGRREGGEVVYQVALRDGVLRLQVANAGQLRTTSESTGLGLANVRARLRHLYGAGAALTLVQAEADLVVAEAMIPVLPTTPAVSQI